MTWFLAAVIVALLFAVGLVAIGYGDPLAEAHPDRPDQRDEQQGS